MPTTNVRIHALISTPNSPEHLAGSFELQKEEEPFLGQEFNLPGIEHPLHVMAFGSFETGRVNVKTFRHSGRGIPDDHIAQTNLDISGLRSRGWIFHASVA